MKFIKKNSINLPAVWSEPFPEAITLPFRLEAAKKFRHFQLPSDLNAWLGQRDVLYKHLSEAMRLKVIKNTEFDLEETASTQMDGYTIKNISYCAAPLRYVTANLFIPDGTGPFPGILLSHGHFPNGRIAENNQALGHILAQCGYVVLMPDTAGSGERSTVHGDPEYHGGFTGAALMNTGETIMGLQVADNMRAIDLLISLPYVDADKIGATGASGGGNQTMWLTAMDERIKAATAVVSSGTFDSYTRSANCVCELLPDGLNISEESGIIALIAPRAFKMMNAEFDSLESFSIGQMLRTYTEARKIFQAYGADDHLSYQVFRTIHGYWPPMMEATAGFFDLHLKNTGHGAAHALPDACIMDDAQIMTYPSGHAPEKLYSLKRYCENRIQILQNERQKENDAQTIRKKLAYLFSYSRKDTIKSISTLPPEDGFEKFSFETAAGIMIPVLFRPGTTGKCTILASGISKKELSKSRILADAMAGNDALVIFDPYGSGENYSPDFSLWGELNYHNLSRYCQWFGFSMFEIWSAQFNLLKKWAAEKFNLKDFTFAGQYDAGTAAIAAGALEPSVSKIITEKSVTSFNLCRSKPFAAAVTMALMVQDILKYCDIPELAALANTEIEFISPIEADGTLLAPERFIDFANQCSSAVTRLKSTTGITMV